MELYYATTNSGKIHSLERYFKGHDVQIKQVPLDIPESRSSNVMEIARDKVLFAYENLKKPVVALDAGFYVPALNGFPGTFVNFTLETIGLEGILKLMEGKDRYCEYRHSLAYLDEELKEPKYFNATVEGTLSHEIRGEFKKHFWSTLALIFMPHGFNTTEADLSDEDYFKWRGIVARESSSKAFVDWFVKERLAKTL